MKASDLIKALTYIIGQEGEDVEVENIWGDIDSPKHHICLDDEQVIIINPDDSILYDEIETEVWRD